MFPSCSVPPDSQDTKLSNSNQGASPSAGKNIGVVLGSCLRLEVRLGISVVSITKMRVTKITSWIGV